MSRDPQEFRKPELIQLFKEGCHAVGIGVIITCVGRIEEQQKALHAQGRKTTPEVNAMRKVVGWPPITDAENRKVTWTLKSKHILDENGKCDAFDFGVIKDGKMIWSIKADVDHDDIPDYLECGG